MISEIVVDIQAVTWLPWIVNYFFFIGIAFSAAWLAAYFGWKGQPYSEWVALAIAVIAVCVAPIALTADLHQPARVWHFYTDFAWWSPMAWGAIFLPLFNGALFGYFALLLKQRLEQGVAVKGLNWLKTLPIPTALLLNLCRVASVLLGLAILLYTVLETYFTQTRALWHSVWLLPIMLSSILPAACWLVEAAVLQKKGQKRPLALGGFCCLWLVILLISLVGLYISSPQAKRDIHELLSVEYGVLILLGVILTGLATGFFNGLTWLTAVLLLAVGWLTRWVVVIEVQTVAKTNALHNPCHLAWTVDGAIGIVAIFGLAVCLSVVMWQFSDYVEKQGGWKDE